MKSSIFFALALFAFSSCSVSKKFAKVAESRVLSEPALKTAHIGISIFDADKQQYIYEHQGDKYFIPASNTKLLTCYAAMKHLGDSLLAAVVADDGQQLFIYAYGDPTLLHPDYKSHPLVNYLKQQTKPLVYFGSAFKENALGFGWAWDDYESDYMAERSGMPIYGNVVSFAGRKDSLRVFPKYFSAGNQAGDAYVSNVSRQRSSNIFSLDLKGKQNRSIDIPFVTSDSLSAVLLSDAIGKPISYRRDAGAFNRELSLTAIHSQPLDSVLKPMMHRSDNFFAEQMLLMVGSHLFRSMNDARIIDTLLKSDLADLPQKPKWVDGSGLSRYNLVSPEDLVTVLNKMNKEFDWKRIETILPTGGEGTLSSYYKQYAGKIYAKTGTLSNNIALSGFLLTDKGKKLIFSVVVNNHQAPTATIRKGVESMLGWLIEHY